MFLKPYDVDWTKEKIARFWDYYEGNLAVSDLYFGAQNGEHVALTLDAKAGLRDAKTILDFSCGKGDLVEAILNRIVPGQMVHAIDVSPKSVENVATRCSGRVGFAGSQVYSGLPTGFAAGTFDLVVLTEVIEHLAPEETDAVVAEIHRLLAPGGRIMVTTPNNECLPREHIMCPDCGCIFHRWQHRQSFSAERLTEKMEGHAFRTVACRTLRWGSTGFRRLVFPLLTLVTPLERTGLYYIGQKLDLTP